MDGTTDERELSDADEKCLVSIKVKTLDSCTYTITVPKDIPVPLLKERIALDANVPPELQRLICRGKVLKDDQRLSEYNVEDGHVLHLVARLAAPATDQGQTSDTPPRITAADTHGSVPSLSGIPGVTMRALSMPVDATGLPDVNRIIASVLNTFDAAGAGERDGAEAAGSRETNNGNGGVRMQSNAQAVELRIDTVYGLPPGLHVLHGSPFGLLGVGGPSSNQADSLVIMRQYLERFQAALQHSAEVARRGNAASESGRVDDVGHDTFTAVPSDVSQSPAPTGSAPTSGPSVTVSSRRADASGDVRPAELLPLLQRVESLLRGGFSDHLSATSREISREQSTLDAAERSALLRVIHQGGNHLQQLGSLLQELGRACLSVRLGSNPGESHMRLGPAVFINQFGPNPMIIQPRRNTGAHQGAVHILASNGGTQGGGVGSHGSTAISGLQSGGASASVVLPVPPASGEAEPSGSGRAAPLSVDHPHSSNAIHLGSQSLPPFGQSPGIERPRDSTGHPGTVDESGNIGASGTLRTPGSLGPSFGPAIAQIQVQIGSTPMQVTGQAEQLGQGTPMTPPTVVAFRPPPLVSDQDVHMREQSMEENEPSLQQGSGNNRGQGTTASTPVIVGASQPVSGTEREAAGWSAPNQNREEGGATLQGDLAHLLSPLIRQLAGALQRVQEISPPPPPPQAPPAAPPAPLQEPVAPQPQEAPSNTSSPPIGTEATQPTAPAQAVGQENRADVDSGVTPLGLGLGGLRPLARPRRRATQPASMEQQLLREGARGLSLGISSNQIPGSSASRDDASTEGTATRQALSGLSNTSSGIDQLLGPMMGMQNLQPGARQGADNPLGNMMQLLGRQGRGNTDATTGTGPLGGMLQALSGGGGGSPGGLGSFMDQMMRSPAMNNMARQLAGPTTGGGLGNMMTPMGEGGGMDLGSMMAQMMPMVSQVLSGIRENQGAPGGAQSRGVNTQQPVTENEEWKRFLNTEEVEMWNAQLAEDEKRQASMEPQRPLSDAYLRSSPFKRRRMAVEKTAQKLQEGADPQEVLKSVTEVAMEGVDGGEIAGIKADCDLPHHISTAPGLAEAYVGVLWHDLANRTATDSDASASGSFDGVRTMLSPENLASNAES